LVIVEKGDHRGMNKRRLSGSARCAADDRHWVDIVDPANWAQQYAPRRACPRIASMKMRTAGIAARPAS
jgi:hypothetical protein